MDTITLERLVKSHEEMIERVKQMRKALEDCNNGLEEYRKKVMANEEEHE